ncbi:hypothetical protein GGI25_000270 [Coemansia spiralis]|uniref:Uncharacterized protein n=2 Tax=Coemansia TaxID=4863 RepID=A0A9W8L1J6_9FUNG|nr:hypothetical protein EDC05_000512 [Coemansia umbellata]KAJ2625842.1 hypothetical protein GGI26_000305 [Coemansia sp. RSA 1358]KAJ2680964.1 hypothetical protein GGI25_000270 [Coemansia spiralis]
MSMDIAESSYWDQYDNEADYFASQPLPPQYRQLPTRSNSNTRLLQLRGDTTALPMNTAELRTDSSDTSSRDSYWSMYLNAQKSSSTGLRTPLQSSVSTTPLQQSQTRLFVVPDRLAALRIESGSTNDEHNARNREKQGITSAAAVPAAVIQNKGSSSNDFPAAIDSGKIETDGSIMLGASRSSSSNALQKDAEVKRPAALVAAAAAAAQNVKPSVVASASSNNSSIQKATTVSSAAEKNNSNINSKEAEPIDSPLARSFEGINPAALISRLNFLKEQMDQDERLLLNSVV